MTDGETVSKAIQAALVQDWNEAVRLNSEIIKTLPTNIDALNRLGFAHLQLGNMTEAKKFFNKVISLDKYNSIAEKNINKISSVKKKQPNTQPQTYLSPLSFLEDPGKTKIIQCLNLASANVLSSVSSGQQVYLKLKKHAIEIRDDDGTYLGVLPDDISYRLIKYINGGNTYTVHIKSVGKNSLTVFIREISRGKKFTNQPSFSSASGFLAESRFEIAPGDKPDISPTGEDPVEPQ